MGRKKQREPLDWSRSINTDSGQETMDEEMMSLMPRSARGSITVASGILGLFQNDLDAEHKVVQRCPKCRRHMMHRLTPEQKKLSPSKSNWVCINCGNDTDEFGNLL